MLLAAMGALAQQPATASPPLQLRIVGGLASLNQFTYGPKPPLPPETIRKLGLRVEVGSKIWLNLPPARIYRFYRIRTGLPIGMRRYAN